LIEDLTNIIILSNKSIKIVVPKEKDFNISANKNQRLLGACNRSPGSKLLSITTQLHCGGHLGGRA
jgi:hypothetical protein